MIERMVGSSGLKDNVLDEYDLRIRMLHASGAVTGPLGVHGLIPLLRQFGLAPRVARPQNRIADWQRLEVGTDVLVQDGDRTLKGQYRGAIANGTVAVAIEGRKFVSEFNASQVVLANTILSGPVKKPQEADARLTLVNTDDDCATDQVPRWSEVPTGTHIRMLVGDDLADGEYVGLAKDKGCVLVTIGGVQHTVGPEDVILVNSVPIAEEPRPIDKADIVIDGDDGFDNDTDYGMNEDGILDEEDADDSFSDDLVGLASEDYDEDDLPEVALL